MKNLLYCIGVLLLVKALIGTSVSRAQSPETKKLTYQAYLQNDFKNWELALDKVEHSSSSIDDPDVLLNIVYVKYGLLNATMATQDEDSFDEYLESTKEQIDRILELDPKRADAHTIKAAVLSLQIAYSPLKGMFLGPKSDSHIEKALKLAPSSAFGWKMYASSKFFTPAMFGGDMEEAVKSYEKSVQLYEETAGETESNWLYLDALAWLGQAYMREERYQEAVDTYEKALKAEPNFGWVQHVLLPAAKEQSN